MSELPSAQYFELRSKNGRNQGMVVLNGQEVTSSTEEAAKRTNTPTIIPPAIKGAV